MDKTEILIDRIEGLRKIIRPKANGLPDRVLIDGVWYDGPLAESYIQMLEKIDDTLGDIIAEANRL